MDYAKMVSRQSSAREDSEIIIAANRDLPTAGAELPGGFISSAVSGVGLPGGNPRQPSAFHQTPPFGHIGIHPLSFIFPRVKV